MSATIINYTIFVILFVFCQFSQFNAKYTLRDTEGLRSQEMLLRELLDVARYEPESPPPGPGKGLGPCEVSVNVYIRNVDAIEERDMSMSVQITFRMSWLDPRLSYNSTEIEQGVGYIQTNDVNANIWRPDLFFANELEATRHDMIVPNTFFRISPDGQVLCSYRISLKLLCLMDLHNFPRDTQRCPITIGSYGFTEDFTRVKWKSGDPVQISPSLHVPRFSLKSFSTTDCASVTNTGRYSCIRVDIYFKRSPTYYTIIFYIPLLMIILVSYCAIWLPPTTYSTARLVIISACLLVMAQAVTFFNYTLGYSPVGYIRKVDYFAGIAICFIMLMLVESIIMAMKQPRIPIKEYIHVNDSGDASDAEKASSSIAPKQGTFGTYYKENKSNIDFWFRILIPIGIVIFIIMS